MIESELLTKIHDIAEISANVLHMLYVCVAILISATIFVLRMSFGIKDAKASAIRAHKRVDKVEERQDILEERIYQLR